MRISDWSSDVCSSDLFRFAAEALPRFTGKLGTAQDLERDLAARLGLFGEVDAPAAAFAEQAQDAVRPQSRRQCLVHGPPAPARIMQKARSAPQCDLLSQNGRSSCRERGCE